MRRVYLEYIKYYYVYVLAAFYLAIFFVFVSVGDVYSNMPTDSVGHTFNFFAVAVRDTDILLQVSSIVAIGWGAYYMVKSSLSRVLSSSASPMRAS